MFKEKTDPFYIISTAQNQEPDVLTHEICHGLFYTNDEYRTKVRRIFALIDLGGVHAFLASTGGYHESVWKDEMQAYLSVDIEFLEKNCVDTTRLKNASQKLKKIFKKYYS